MLVEKVTKRYKIGKMNEKTFRPENLKKKGIFRKWAVFPHFLCRLHRNRTKNVGNAPLAHPVCFFYTF